LSFVFLAVAPVVFTVSSTEAFAQVQDATPDQYNENALVRTMCNALKIVTGNAGKAFAAFAILSVGIGFFTGKVSWGLMIGVAAGIALIFGAPSVVSAITGEQAYECTTTED
jgi:type IV secretory pathway VirB2 component (pilin)